LSFVSFADARLSLLDFPADAWQLHDGCVLGLLGPARVALNSSRFIVIALQVPSVVTCVVIVVLLRMLNRTGRGSLSVMPLSRQPARRRIS
jgi:hypothetical protein